MNAATGTPFTGHTTYCIHSDHLDSPRSITNTAGQEVWRWDNADPFGNNIANENPANQGTFTFNLRFPGQYFDRETGLHYNVNRDYNPAVGRYVESDPIGLQGGINTYGYVGGNPLGYTDPLGLWVYGTYNQKTGELSMHDLETGQSYSSQFNSGGRPWGDPIPNGIYDILYHPDTDFYRLEPVDSNYGNDKVDRNGRDEFRLHRPGASKGCITADDRNQWKKMRDMIRNTLTDSVTVKSKSLKPWASPTEQLIRYGRIVVVNSN